jgi:hypothetical protein
VIVAAIDKLDVGMSNDHITNMRSASLELRHWTSGNGRIFESLEGRDINYSARIETQLNVVGCCLLPRYRINVDNVPIALQLVQPEDGHPSGCHSGSNPSG